MIIDTVTLPLNLLNQENMSPCLLLYLLVLIKNFTNKFINFRIVNYIYEEIKLNKNGGSTQVY